MGDERLEAWLKGMDQRKPEQSADALRDEAFRRPLPVQQGNCIRCHDKGPSASGNGFKLELTPLRGYDDLMPKRPATPVDAEAALVGKFEKLPITDKAAVIMTRLPDFKIDATKDKITLATDFVKALEAVPGLKLSPEAKDYLGKAKSVSFENGTWSIKLDKEIQFGAGLGKMGPEISFKVKNDASKPNGIGLTDIKGLTLLGGNITDLSVKTAGGKASIQADGTLFGAKFSKDIDLAAHGVSGDLLKQAIGTLSEYGPMIQNRDFGKFTDAVPEGMKTTVSDMLKGVTSISKEGDEFKLKRDNGMAKFDFGGPTVSVGSEVAFKLGRDPEAPSIKDLRGITVTLPVPQEIGIGSNYISQIKGVSLGLADSRGGRTLRVDANNVIDRVEVRLDGNFKPRTDADGNWNVGVAGTNPLAADGRKLRMNFDIRMGANGQPNMRASEGLDIASKLAWQASDGSGTGLSMGYSAGVAKVGSWIAGILGW